jgi:hypothetical protein
MATVLLVLMPSSLIATIWLLIPMLAFVILAARTLDRLTHRHPTRGFGLYVPALAGLLFVGVGGAIASVPPETWDRGDSGAAGDSGIAGLAVFVLLAVFLPLLAGWGMTREEIAMWVPAQPEIGNSPDRSARFLTLTPTAAQAIFRAAISDTVGRGLWVDARRRSSHSVASAEVDRTDPGPGAG